MEKDITKEDNNKVIKVVDIDENTKIQYLISTLLYIVNRWKKIRMYIINKGD